MSLRRGPVELGVAQVEAWEAFLQTHARITAALERELLAEWKLPLAWYDVLYQLKARGGRLRAKELARAVVLSKSGLTRLVDRLANAGYVERLPDGQDGRGVQVCLTRKGRSVQRRAAPAHMRGVHRHFGAFLDDAEANELFKVLSRMVAADGPDDVQQLEKPISTTMVSC